MKSTRIFLLLCFITICGYGHSQSIRNGIIPNWLVYEHIQPTAKYDCSFWHQHGHYYLQGGLLDSGHLEAWYGYVYLNKNEWCYHITSNVREQDAQDSVIFQNEGHEYYFSYKDNKKRNFLLEKYKWNYRFQSNHKDDDALDSVNSRNKEIRYDYYYMDKEQLNFGLHRIDSRCQISTLRHYLPPFSELPDGLFKLSGIVNLSIVSLDILLEDNRLKLYTPDIMWSLGDKTYTDSEYTRLKQWHPKKAKTTLKLHFGNDFKYDSLQMLYVEGRNYLDYKQAEFDKLKSLRELYLYSGDVYHTKLNLANCNIKLLALEEYTSIDKSNGELNKKLFKRKQLPNILKSTAPTIEEFRLENFKLTQNDPDLIKFKHLQVLNTTIFSKLRHLPDEVDSLTNLRVLMLNPKNKRFVNKQKLTKLPNLKWVCVYNGVWNKNVFMAPNLERIDLIKSNGDPEDLAYMSPKVTFLNLEYVKLNPILPYLTNNHFKRIIVQTKYEEVIPIEVLDCIKADTIEFIRTDYFIRIGKYQIRYKDDLEKLMKLLRVMGNNTHIIYKKDY